MLSKETLENLRDKFHAEMLKSRLYSWQNWRDH